MLFICAPCHSGTRGKCNTVPSFFVSLDTRLLQSARHSLQWLPRYVNATPYSSFLSSKPSNCTPEVC